MTPRPEFVLGVTGHMDLGQFDAIRNAVAQVLRWVISNNDAPPLGGGLRLEATPVAILSSLAPGADTLVVEAVEQELAGRHCLYAPLPFPADLYLQASTFKSITPEERLSLEQRLRSLGERAFFVPLLEDAELSLEDLRRRLEADLDIPERRRLRYRAAGEYVAANSHLLIALTNETAHPTSDEATDQSQPAGNKGEPALAAGACSIVGVKREGLTPGLLAAKSITAWSDVGPVIHIYAPRSDPVRNPPDAPPAGQITVLYPLDSKPDRPPQDSPIPNADPEWVRNGDGLFRRTNKALEQFNCETQQVDESNEAREINQLLGCDATSIAAGQFGLIPAQFEALDRVARVRWRAAKLTRGYSERTGKVLLKLFCLTLLAAFLLHAAVHWHTAEHAPPQPPGHIEGSPEVTAVHTSASLAVPPAAVNHAASWWIQAFLLSLSLLLFALSWRTFRDFKDHRIEETQFDARALAEGLRVQFYWGAAGISQSVAANYMNRQQNEMHWIRRAIRSVAAPPDRFREWFQALSLANQVQLLRAIARVWVGGQRKYYVGRSDQYKDNLHFWHNLGLSLAVAGVMHGCVLLVWVWRPDWFDLSHIHAGVRLLLVLIGVLLLVSLLALLPPERLPVWPPSLRRLMRGPWVVRYRNSCRQLSQRSHAVGTGRRTPAAAVISVASFCLCIGLGGLPLVPSAQNAWIIAMGSLLVAGALAVAWAEKNLYAENANQFNVMASLFRAAERRIDSHLAAAEKLLKAGGTPGPGGGAAAEASVRAHIAAIQELLYELGVEALDEHAEWLMLHRARPLEPVMAG